MARNRGQNLDQWATALGATNDTDALRLLTKTLAMTVHARNDCVALVRATHSAPDDDASTSATRAVIAFDWLAESIERVCKEFKRHSRGQG
ncbi:hypothetical protein AB0P21_14705 [Kribbella sp. NPDC056861]|uniref:hypothetical protein n=1 Tax=Kribbella sp. NPDC056861 TaxID=3154857 RepID=UPI003417C1B1